MLEISKPERWPSVLPNPLVSLPQTNTNNLIMALGHNIGAVDFTQYHEDYYHKLVNGKHCIFISIRSNTRVFPSPQELRELLTHEGSKHHSIDIINGG